MAYYECSSKEEPESIIITLVPDMKPLEDYGRLSSIYFYIDDTLIATYSSGGRYYFSNKTYNYTSPKSNKSVTITIIANIITFNDYGAPQSIQLGINGTVVQTLSSGGRYFMHGAIVYKYTFS